MGGQTSHLTALSQGVLQRIYRCAAAVSRRKIGLICPLDHPGKLLGPAGRFTTRKQKKFFCHREGGGMGVD